MMDEKEKMMISNNLELKINELCENFAKENTHITDEYIFAILVNALIFKTCQVGLAKIPDLEILKEIIKIGIDEYCAQLKKLGEMNV